MENKTYQSIIQDLAVNLSNSMFCDRFGSCVHFAEEFIDLLYKINPDLLTEVNVIEGYVHTNDGKFEHTWIELNDGTKIDPTFKQFVGTVHKITNSKKYTGIEYFNDNTYTWFRDRRKSHPEHVFKSVNESTECEQVLTEANGGHKNYGFCNTCVDYDDGNEIVQITGYDDFEYTSNTYYHDPDYVISKEQFLNMVDEPVRDHDFYGYNPMYDIVFGYNDDDDIHYFYHNYNLGSAVHEASKIDIHNENSINESITESTKIKFLKFVNEFKKYDPVLVEAIRHGYNAIFESRGMHISDEMLSKYNLNSDDVHYLGSGDFGSAYSIGDGKVLKITTSKSEAELAHEIMNGKFNSFVTIYSVEKYADEYYIIQEELEVDSDLENAWYEVSEALESQGLPVQYVGNFDEDEYAENGGELSEEATELMNALWGIDRDYRRLGIEASDIRVENMGRSSDGTIKAFDIDDRSRL